MAFNDDTQSRSRDILFLTIWLTSTFYVLDSYVTHAVYHRLEDVRIPQSIDTKIAKIILNFFLL